MICFDGSDKIKNASEPKAVMRSSGNRHLHFHVSNSRNSEITVSGKQD